MTRTRTSNFYSVANGDSTVSRTSRKTSSIIHCRKWKKANEQENSDTNEDEEEIIAKKPKRFAYL